MARDDAYLLDLLLMAKDAQEFTKNHTLQSFKDDRQCQYAVIRCLEVIGKSQNGCRQIHSNSSNRSNGLQWHG